MAKEIGDSGARRFPPSTPKPAGRTRYPVWRRAGLIVATALAGISGAALFLFLAAMPQRVDVADLPPTPNLAGKPPALATALTDARHRASDGGSDAWQGLADLARLYQANGFMAEAEQCWLILCALQPRSARWVYYLADLRRIAVDDDGFKSYLQQTVERAPGYAPAWLNLAELELKSGQLDAAARAYARRLELIPGDPYARLGLARVTLLRGQRVQAREQIEALLRDVPHFSSGHNFYAGLLAQDGDAQGEARQRWLGTVAERFRAAEDPWLEELREACFDADQLIIWGDIDAQTKHGDRGKALFERAIRVEPGNPRGYVALGNCYLEANANAKAVEVLERGARLSRGSERLYILLARAYDVMGRHTDAQRAAGRAVALKPESASAHLALAAALEEAGRSDAAIAAYRAAIARAPNEADPVVKLGVAFARLSRMAEAHDCFERAIELQPGFPMAVIMLGSMELDAGRLDAAARLIMPYFRQYLGLREAKELVSRLYAARAMAAVEAGDASGVERACQEGLALVSDSPELNGLLGILRMNQHRFSEALAGLEYAHRLRPTDLRVSLSLGKLYAELGRVGDARRLLNDVVRKANQQGQTALAADAAGFLQTLRAP